MLCDFFLTLKIFLVLYIYTAKEFCYLELLKLLLTKKELMELIAQHYKTLFYFLENDDLDVFEKYDDCFTKYASMIECQVFEICLN